MTKGAARNATIVVMVACIAFHISFLLVQINLCQPVSRFPTSIATARFANNRKVAKQWNPAITSGKCLPAVPFYTSMASLTICFDIAVYVHSTQPLNPI
jgi:hypothetical protein